MSSTVYSGLLVDWGGVMMTSVFASFRAFCEQEGLDPARQTIGALERLLGVDLT